MDALAGFCQRENEWASGTSSKTNVHSIHLRKCVLYKNTFLWFFFFLCWFHFDSFLLFFSRCRGRWRKKLLIRILSITILLSFSAFFFFGNVKMRLTFMVVFFTIYNAQSQRKRKFSCINQRPWKQKRKSAQIGVLVRCVEIYSPYIKLWRIALSRTFKLSTTSTIHQ